MSSIVDRDGRGVHDVDPTDQDMGDSGRWFGTELPGPSCFVARRHHLLTPDDP
jgi:hypothetical protein